MSADNFYIVRKHPFGGYAAVQGFASDVDDNDEQIYPEANVTDQQFKSIGEALNWAVMEYSEYGVDVHPECESKSVIRRIKHTLGKPWN
jgi:hypothetical protein